MKPNGVRCCFAGAILASLSWGIIFFMYTNMDIPQLSESSRRINFVPRYNRSPSKEHKEVDDREQNRPGYGRARIDNRLPDKNDMRPNSGNLLEEVKEGEYTDPLEASKINTDRDREDYKRGVNQHSFNEYLSNRLSFRRPVTDTRDERCAAQAHTAVSLSQVSIIMCFYNEALSVLLRSLHSIWTRTKSSLIREILLVDDNSDIEGLKANLESYIRQHFDGRVEVIRNPQREGLIRSRMIGANRASADVLVFLDSHIEVNAGWLEPLTSRAAEGNSVVLPIIDIIDPDTFIYHASPLVRGGFTWTMRFSWEEIPSSILDTDPLYIKSPTMAGGLLAIRRDYFFHLGGYDLGMDIWGGENIEMSLRVWMCGGEIEIAVCSRVGHIFRKVRPYSSPNGEDTMTRNTLRMANVWLDDYIDRFHQTSNNRYIGFKYGDVSDRVTLRKGLNCHDFTWYLTNVYNPDLKMSEQSAKSMDKKKETALQSSSKLTVINKGKLKLMNTDYCILPSTSNDVILSNSPVILVDCATSRMKWYELEDGGFLIEKNKCLDVVSSSATISKCTGQGGTQHWLLQEKTDGFGLLFNRGTGLCLTAPQSELGARVIMGLCHKATLFTYSKKRMKTS